MSQPTPPPSTTRRVAVVVFCEVDAASTEVAEDVAVLAVRHAVAGGQAGAREFAALRHPMPVDIGFVRPTDEEPFTALVTQVTEVGVAAGNGYLWTAPTAKAFPRRNTQD